MARIKKPPPKRLPPPPPAIRELLRRLNQASSDAALADVLHAVVGGSSVRASDTATAVSASLTSSTAAASHAAGDWPYPKADMNHFVPLLNRLDALLESAVAAHKVELVETRAAGTGAGQEVNTEMVDAATAAPSSNAASSVEPTATSSNAVPAPSSNTMSTATSGATTTSPTVPFVVVFPSGEASAIGAIATKHLLLGILRFTRLLHENATNRNLYNSYEHLNDLLLATDLDIVEATLALLLRPAQRLSAQRSLRGSVSIDNTRVAAMFKAWGPKEHGFHLAGFVHAFTEPGAQRSAPDTLKFQFYRTARSTDGTAVVSSGDAADSGLVVVQVELPKDGDVVAGMKQLIERYALGPEQQPTALHLLRILHKMRSAENREMLLRIRCLATAVLVNLLNEGQAHAQIFSVEPSLVADMAELLQIDRKLALSVQTCAIYVLEALCQYRGCLPDVLAALNASANHGILMFILRKVIADMELGIDYPVDYVEALFGLLSALLMSQTGGNMIINGGMVPVLSRLVQNTRTQHMKLVARCIGILDNAMHSFPAAFPTLLECDGLETFVSRIKTEYHLCANVIDETARTSAADTNTSPRVVAGPIEAIPFERLNLFKSLLKFLWHVMQQSGATDRVRNLSEGPVPDIVCGIIVNQQAFGAAIFALAINIMATFIHNEPLSFNVLHEKQIPQEFLKAVPKYLPPAAELLSAIPNAIGALCLNSAGLELVTQNNPFPAYFSVFSSAEHFRVLIDEDIVSVLGQGLDELVRHHPSLKELVMKAFIAAMELGLTVKTEILQEQLSLYSFDLQRAAPGELESDVKMVQADVKAEEAKDPVHVHCIEVIARFLESFFENAQHCKEFVDLGGMALLLRFYRSGKLPFDFASSSASYSLSHIFRIITDTGNPATVLRAMLAEFSQSYEAASTLLNFDEQTSLLAKFVDLRADEEQRVAEGSALFQSLVTLHSHVGLLSDVYSSPVFTNPKASQEIVQVFSEEDGLRSIRQLYHFYRVCALESLYFKTAIPRSWIHTKPKKPKASKDAGTDKAALLEKAEIADPMDRRVKNTRYFKYLLSQSTAFIVPIMKGLSKILVVRRAEASHRQHGIVVADAIAEGLCAHMTWGRVPSEPSVQKYHYLHICAALVQTAIVDERSGNALLTVVASSFVQKGGLGLISKTLDTLIEDGAILDQRCANLPSDNKADQEAAEETVAKFDGALEDVLKVFSMLVSSRTLHDSPHTQSLIASKDGSALESPFQPHAFLVACRTAVLESTMRLWNSDLLAKCPTKCVQLLLRILASILKADGELISEEKLIRNSLFAKLTGAVDANASAPPAMLVSATSGSSQSRHTSGDDIEAMSDDGDESFEDVDPEESATTVGPSLTDGTSSSTGMATSEAAATGTASKSTPPPDLNIEARQELDHARSKARRSIIDVGLELIVKKPDVMFEFKDICVEIYQSAISTAASGPDSTVEGLSEADRLLNVMWERMRVEPLLNSYLAATTNDNAVLSPIIVEMDCRLHFLALLCADPDVQPKVMDRVVALFPTFRNAMDKHVGELAVRVGAGADADGNLPTGQTREPWLSSILLMIETLLAHDANMSIAKQISLSERLVSDADEEALLGSVYSLLSCASIDTDMCNAAMRLLVRLTRKPALASKFLALGGLRTLVDVKKRHAFRGHSTLSHLIVRHLFETMDVLKATMEREIATWMAFPRMRIVDVTSFVRNFAPAILRQREAFLSAARNLCRLTIASDTIKQQITLVKYPKLESAEATAAATETDTSVITEPQQATVHFAFIDNLQKALRDDAATIVHLLMAELLTFKRSGTSTPLSANVSTEGITAAAASSSTSGEPATVASTDADVAIVRQQRCFLLQLLAEIFTSYPATKSYLLSFTKGRSVTEGTMRAPRSFLNYVITELLPYARIVTSKATLGGPDRLQMNESEWASNLISTLCRVESEVKMSTNGVYVNCLPVGTDQQDVLVFVVEQLSRCIKDTAHVLPIDKRFGRYHAFADLITGILASKPAGGNIPFGQGETTNEATLAVVKTMLDKGYVQSLTSVLGDLDPNYPDVRTLVNALLRPLETISRLGNKISQSEPAPVDLRSTGTPPDVKKQSLMDSLRSPPAIGLNAGPSSSRPTGTDASENFIRDSALGMYSAGGAAASRRSDSDTDYSDDDGDDDEMMEGMDEMGDMDEEPDDFTDMSEDSMSPDENSDDDADMDVVVRPTLYDDGDDDDGESGSEGDSDDDDPMADVRGRHANGERPLGDSSSDDSGSGIQTDSDDDGNNSDNSDAVWTDIGEEDDSADAGDVLDFVGDDVSNAGEAIVPGGNGESGMDEGTSDSDDDDDVDDEDAADDGDAYYDDYYDDGEDEESGGGGGFLANLGHRNNRRGSTMGAGVAFPEHFEVSVAVGNGPAMLLNDFLAVPGASGGGNGGAARRGLFIDDFAAPRDGLAQHPLLDRAAAARRPASRSTESLQRAGITYNGGSLLRDSDGIGREFNGNNALQLLEQVLQSAAGVPGPFHQHLANFTIEQTIGQSNDMLDGDTSGSRTALESTEFRPNKTSERWMQEARLVFTGGALDTKVVGVQEELVAALLPIAQEIEKNRKAQEAREKETARLRDEEAREAKEKERREREEKERSEREAAANEASSAAAMDVDAGPSTAPQSSSNSAAAAPASTYVIHGTTIDLSNSGIDPTFLEALPEDMRAEVLAQHFRDQMGTGLVLPDVADISEEFLEALPEDIREEVLQQEALGQQLRNARNGRGNGGAQATALPGAPFADSLRSMTGDISAFARIFGGDPIAAPGASSSAATAVAGKTSAQQAPLVLREPTQLMDRTAIAAIIRYLFLPQPLSRSYLYPLMVNLCDNSKSRAELMLLLIGIIHECLSVDGGKIKSGHATGRRSSVGARKSLSATQLQSIMAPLLAVNTGTENFASMAIHRCLDLCTELVSKNEAVISFFLTELSSSDANGLLLPSSKGGSKRSNKQGKVPCRYPVAELLALMEKPMFLKNSALMDDLTLLIASVVQPLSKHRPAAGSQLHLAAPQGGR